MKIYELCGLFEQSLNRSVRSLCSGNGLSIPYYGDWKDNLMWLDADLERGSMKSNVSEYLELLQVIYLDACSVCVADVSDLRDLITIKSRVESEGLSFLTITLPDFCKDFERSLEIGFIDPTSFRSFRKNGSIPAFLQGMIGLLFDRGTGRICDEDNLLSPGFVSSLVDSVRQICLTFKKMELNCTPKRVQKALDDFFTIEQSFSLFEVPEDESQSFLDLSSCLWGPMLDLIDPNIFLPRHGPGATAERISGNQKFIWQLWHDRLEPHFPFLENAYPYGMGIFGLKELDLVKFVRPNDEQPVRVTPVPKTLKGPRIIAIEPCCMQYTQQGIRDVLYDVIESSEFTKGHVLFRDQSVNQDLAILSSKTGRLATIDLSDASDRVPLSLAIRMFDSNPSLKASILACRSTRAELPDGTIIGPLRKFASMGSALCFPIEAMYFYTICVKALLEVQNLPISRKSIFAVTRDIYVYGDDILVPSIYATVVLDHLQKYNCKVNTSKTFWTGKFRESCGVDAYDGRRVTPLYLRRSFPENRRQASEAISLVCLANSFYKKGYWQTCSYLYKRCEQVLGPLPYVSETSPILGRISFLGYRSVVKWNEKIQSFEVRGWKAEPVRRTDELEGYGALQKSLSRLQDLSGPEAEEDVPFMQAMDRYDPWVARDELHLSRSALHRAVTLKRGWAVA